MISLVYLTARSPSKLGDELQLAGYRVFEALALSEVLYLQEHENMDPFDFYLDRYKQQLVAGYTKETPTFGLRVFMRDFNKLKPSEKRSLKSR